MIDEPEARKLAEEAGRNLLASLLASQDSAVLSADVVKGDVFWIFYRRRDIQIHPDDFRHAKAFAVGRFGDVLIVADYLDDNVRLRDHIVEMSTLFKKIETRRSGSSAPT